ncbi:3-oxoacyl-[acyl-carrier-protein] synthase 3 [Kitasatospora indigofera]|uniref:3-oxoacyl-[acyl-carrier-protein] synthase 3 n=1 Tax=Kitasatospora indigofera TaxID=67307 RepID=A0A919GF68_9ACTN|nr:ketoacyl-ACP synthase III [Kitasatospora indigofera]GHH83797.1 3-oxoacyl-[acyl-carrier-protein] synthase 3 [Kitasatospora indigofera]
MNDQHAIGIISTGSYLPANVVDNEEVARRAGVTAQWIERKTGIRQRRRAASFEATSDLAAAAARCALAQAGLDPERISLILVATSTPDHPQPATASIVQSLIGARNAAAFDVNAVCSGFVFALTAAERMLRAEPEDSYALVIGADVYSRILDHSDSKTAILFGDGAGAVVLGRVPAGQGTLSSSLLTRGDQHGLISVPAGGSRRPASAATLAEGGHFFRMDGRGVRGFVQENLPQAVRALLAKAGTAAGEVHHFVPHQANGVMLGEVWPGLGLDAATCHLTLERLGNTGAASIPITLDLVHRQGAFAEDELLLVSGFGGGMSVGSVLLRWAATTHARPSAAEREDAPLQLVLAG